jgi:hypothetical protein
MVFVQSSRWVNEISKSVTGEGKMKAMCEQYNQKALVQTGLSLGQWIGLTVIACALSGALSLIYQVYQSVV